MALDDFEPAPCAEDADCEAAQRAFPDSDGCGTYECREGLCVLPAGEECNGKDDDCDGWIDEGITRVSAEMSVAAPSDVSAFASASHGSTTYVVAGAESNQAWTIVDGVVHAAGPLRYGSAKASDGRPCPTEGGTTECDFAQVALAADARHLVYASINQVGCADGQLRIGLAPLDGDKFTVWLGKSANAISEDQNNIAFGVDGGDSCTGASHPAVATLDTAPEAPGALVAWLSASLAETANEADCGDAPPSTVKALGVFVPKGEVDWLNGTNEGRSEVLGRTTSHSPPAVLARGVDEPPAYWVAFATEVAGTRGVQLLSVRASNPLEFQALLLIPDPQAHAVTLSAGTDAGEVGIAWSSGCAEQATLRFASLRALEGSGELELVSEPLSIPAPNRSYGPKALFRSAGFATAAPAGGWALLWVEDAGGGGGRLKLARIGQETRDAFDQVTLGSSALGRPVFYTGTELGFGYALLRHRSRDQITLETNGGWCDVRD